MKLLIILINTWSIYVGSDCYHPPTAGAPYLPTGAPGAGQSQQAAMRVPTGQQPQPPQQQQQDLTKNAMVYIYFKKYVFPNVYFCCHTVHRVNVLI